jgi:hypothetical protein
MVIRSPLRCVLIERAQTAALAGHTHLSWTRHPEACGRPRPGRRAGARQVSPVTGVY